MKRGKHAAKSTIVLNKRLLTGLIVSMMVMVALCIGAGIAVCGLYWNWEESDGLTADNMALQGSMDGLQKSLAEQKQKVTEAMGQLADMKRQLEAAQQDNAALEEANRELKDKLDTAQRNVEELQDKLAGLQGSQPVYPANAKLIALTFDDGPGGKTTPRLLDILKEKQVKATFFMVGKNAERYPAIVQRVAEEGHVIGTHTYSHQRLTALTSQGIAEEIDKSMQIFTNILGVAPTLLRPPGGHYNDDVVAYTKDHHQRIIMWSVDTRDWESRDRDKILETAFQETAYGVRDGAIVLMHDVYDTTVDAVGEMIDRLKADGYTLVTVPELLRVRAGGGEGGGVYRYLKPA